MIKTYRDLMDVIRYEKPLYPNSIQDYLIANQRTYNWKYVKLLRWSEYFYNNKNTNLFWSIGYVFVCRRKNTLGAKLGIQIWENNFDKGLTIHHNGNIVVNRETRVGKDCQLHGDNCLGNDGKGNNSPILGDNVDIGVGAKVLGSVVLNNNVKIASNAVVVNTFNESNITLGGVPAIIIKRG